MSKQTVHYFRSDWITPTDRVIEADVIVYGATSAGVAAAVHVVRAGKTVALLHPGQFIGGLTTGGLGWTDYGKQHVVGGFARELYQRIGTHYGKSEEWMFEPHIAQRAIDALLSEAGIEPVLAQFLDKVERVDGRITSIKMIGGLVARGRYFIDATYEGDLLARAGVSYHVGRESNATYGETINGIQVRKQHQFEPATVSPFVIDGDESSGLLPGIEPLDLRASQGQGDRRIQAYNFRVCMTDDPQLRIDWPKPDTYLAANYELLARWLNSPKDAYNDMLPNYEGRPQDVPKKFDCFPNPTPGGYRKTDTNNHGPVSSDFIGANHAWPESNYEQREAIFQKHVDWQQGMYWFMANDSRVPERYRNSFKQFGLPRDEFVTTGHWPHALYVREARRMIGQEVLTEHECMHERPVNAPVGMGSYTLDSHNCSRFVAIVNGKPVVMNEGDVQRAVTGPYGIGYGSIIPRAQECQNLLVPVCCSTSHIAYGSVRMEPVFMILGQSCAMAACIAIDAGCVAVQDVKYDALRSRLDMTKQILPE